MTENSHPETPADDPERRHARVREWMIDALSLAVTGLAIFHYKPAGTLADLIFLAGAYVVAEFLVKLLWALSGVLLAWLSVLLYFSSLVMGLTSLPAMLLAVCLPGVAQAYWIWALWPATGTLTHPLTLSCVAWLVLLGIRVFERDLFGGRKPTGAAPRCLESRGG